MTIIHEPQQNLVTAERTVLAACVTTPKLIDEIFNKIKITDIDEPVNVAIFNILLGMRERGREPSVETIISEMGDYEIADGTSLRAYLKGAALDYLSGLLYPLQDSIEVVLDQSRKRTLGALGEALQSGASAPGADILDLGRKISEQIEEMLSSARVVPSQSYTAEDAAQAAIDHMNSSNRVYPTTGLVDLDRMLGGWALGQLHIIAGRPGMAKSASATGCVTRAAKAGHAVMFFSLEMQKEQLGSRLLTDLAYTQMNPIYYEDVLHKRHKGDDRIERRLFQAKRELSGLPLLIVEQRGLNLAEISSRARKYANKLVGEGRRLELIFVDHIGLVQASGRYAGNRHREVAEITDGLATLAKELDCAVIGLCQLNRGVEGREDKRPQLSDLRDSGSIEEDASSVTFLYRPAYYLEQKHHEDPAKEEAREMMLRAVKNQIEFIVSKNRNGRVGIVNAFVDIGANAIRNGSY